MINIICSDRGIGKSYGAKKKMLKNEFIYLRRYKEEVKMVKNKLFNDIDNEFKLQGSTYYKDGKEWGYIYALSQAQSLKSAAFPHVKIIVFDEFIIEDKVHHYLKDEIDLFISILSTVNRNRSGKDKVKIYMLCNPVTKYNPYFSYYGITPALADKDVYYNKDKNILYYNYRNTDFEENFNNTEFSKTLKQNTKDYLLNKKYVNDCDDNLICSTPLSPKYLFTLICNNKSYGVYFSNIEAKFFITEKYEKNCKKIYALNSKDLRINVCLFKLNPYLKILKKYYQLGGVCFDSVGTKRNMELLEKMLN